MGGDKAEEEETDGDADEVDGEEVCGFAGPEPHERVRDIIRLEVVDVAA